MEKISAFFCFLLQISLASFIVNFYVQITIVLERFRLLRIKIYVAELMRHDKILELSTSEFGDFGKLPLRSEPAITKCYVETPRSRYPMLRLQHEMCKFRGGDCQHYAGVRRRLEL